MIRRIKAKAKFPCRGGVEFLTSPAETKETDEILWKQGQEGVSECEQLLLMVLMVLICAC